MSDRYADISVDADALRVVIAERRAKVDALSTRLATDTQELAALEQLLATWTWLESLAAVDA